MTTTTESHLAHTKIRLIRWVAVDLNEHDPSLVMQHFPSEPVAREQGPPDALLYRCELMGHCRGRSDWRERELVWEAGVVTAPMDGNPERPRLWAYLQHGDTPIEAQVAESVQTWCADHISETGTFPRKPVPPGFPTCRVCGCWDHDACVGGQGPPCHWVEPDLCSACDPAEARVSSV